MNRPNQPLSDITPPDRPDTQPDHLDGLTADELLAELARVEASLRRLSALAVQAEDNPGSDGIQRPYRQREHAIVDELTARRHRRGLVAAPLAQERPTGRTPPPWA